MKWLQRFLYVTLYYFVDSFWTYVRFLDAEGYEAIRFVVLGLVFWGLDHLVTWYFEE
ncbi:hypothetical protein [Risungbinella massiliensis]|uniref:hypothetical protein n=1 Tax=Risungbinella massiliensis TaxID=1329796 RepID=UPI0012B675DD|nr:hypothetical protein [Risungbinella massiliensis]